MDLTSALALAILADNPVCYFQCQECNGVLADSGSNGRAFTITGGQHTYRLDSLQVNQDTYSIDFAGGSSGDTSPVATTATNNVSMEVWIKITAPYVTVTRNAIWYNGASGSNGYGILVNLDLTVQLLLGGVAFAGSAGPISVDTVHQLVIVRDAGTWKIYIDGALANASASVSNPNVPGTSTFIGGVGIQRKQAHMAVYNTALSAARVQAHWDARLVE